MDESRGDCGQSAAVITTLDSSPVEAQTAKPSAIGNPTASPSRPGPFSWTASSGDIERQSFGPQLRGRASPTAED